MGKRQNKAKRFHVLWEEVNKNLADYVTKHHPIWSEIKMRPKYVIATQKRRRKLKRPANWYQKRVC